MKREELLINAKPILFNTEMVKAILEGRKTVTRRVLKPKLKDGEYGCHIWFNKTLNRHIVEKYDEDESDFTPTRYVNQPYEVGDILYVRETFDEYTGGYCYKADWQGTPCTWKPSIHMPKEAARLFLKVTNVRVEKLQDITEDGIVSEGVEPRLTVKDRYSYDIAKVRFSELWNSTINKQDLDEYGWEANPYVWVIEFEKVNVDE